MSRKHTNLSQLSPLDVVSSLKQSISIWLEGLTRISARLYESAPEVWRAFKPIRKEMESRIQFLDYEGEISLQMPAIVALEILFKEFSAFKNKFALVIAHADQAIGRKNMIAAFKCEK